MWAPFWLQLGGPRVNQNLAFAPPFGSWGCLGAKMAQRPLQEAPGSDFWLPTWWILGPKFMDFRSNLYSIFKHFVSICLDGGRVLVSGWLGLGFVWLLGWLFGCWVIVWLIKLVAQPHARHGGGEARRAIGSGAPEGVQLCWTTVSSCQPFQSFQFFSSTGPAGQPRP